MGVCLARIEVVQVEMRRRAQDLQDIVALLFEARRLFGVEIAFGDGHLRPFREDAHRVHEIDVFDLADEGDDVAGNAAAETVVELPFRIDGEGGRLFVMEGTAPPPVPALALERDVCGDKLHDVCFAL